jgi:hypothetical protein
LVEDNVDYTLPLCDKVLGVDLGIETFCYTIYWRKSQNARLKTSLYQVKKTPEENILKNKMVLIKQRKSKIKSRKTARKDY